MKLLLSALFVSTAAAAAKGHAEPKSISRKDLNLKVSKLVKQSHKQIQKKIAQDLKNPEKRAQLVERTPTEERALSSSDCTQVSYDLEFNAIATDIYNDMIQCMYSYAECYTSYGIDISFLDDDDDYSFDFTDVTTVHDDDYSFSYSYSYWTVDGEAMECSDFEGIVDFVCATEVQQVCEPCTEYYAEFYECQMSRLVYLTYDGRCTFDCDISSSSDSASRAGVATIAGAIATFFMARLMM